MVAPVVGPTLTITGSRTGTAYTLKSGFKQSKPYNIVTTPFVFRKHKSQLSANKTVYLTLGGMDDYISLETDAVQPPEDNAAYTKFLGKMRAQNASLGVTLAEQSSARKMMIKRSRQMLGLGRALLVRDFKTAYRICTADFNDPPTKTRWHPKTFANLWLEWSWGWSPMISDIGESLKTLVDPVTPIYVRATHSNLYVNSLRYYSNQSGFAGYYWRQVAEDRWDLQRTSSTGATVSVSSENVALANRLGLLNLPQIAWQVQPFSFIIDKYVNVGQMIGSLSDTYGFTLTNAWKSRRLNIQAYGTFVEYRSTGGPDYIHERYTATSQSEGKRRLSGLLGPTFTFRRPTIGSFGEAASYMALLTQLLSSNKPK
jgi:hypothetical protein